MSMNEHGQCMNGRCLFRIVPVAEDLHPEGCESDEKNRYQEGNGQGGIQAAFTSRSCWFTRRRNGESEGWLGCCALGKFQGNSFTSRRISPHVQPYQSRLSDIEVKNIAAVNAHGPG